jgi:ribosomal protein S18 acetylase RimI-like enzyme
MTSPSAPTLTARDGTVLDLRMLTTAEIPALQRFDAALSPATRAWFLPHAYDGPTLAGYVARQAAGRDRIFVLGLGSEVVGYFFLWEFDQPVPLVGLGLADAWQGQGLGEPLLRFLIREAETAGRAGLELTTVTGNARALHLYRKVGFDLAGEVDNVAGDGRVVREHRMFLALRSGARPPDRKFRPPV